MTDNTLEIRREMIDLQARLKKLPQVQQQLQDDPQGDPQEIADGMMLSRLYGDRLYYLDTAVQLSCLRETVKQMKLNPLGWTRVAETELKLALAEREIEDWDELLPEWQQDYQRTKAKILARPGSKLKVFLLEEEESARPPLKVSGTLPPLTEVFPESETRRAFAQAVVELGANASAQQVCEWLDDHDGLLDLPENWMTDGNERSFATAYKKSSLRHPIESLLDKVKDKLRETGRLPRLN